MVCHTCICLGDVCQCFTNPHRRLVLYAKFGIFYLIEHTCALKHLNNKYAGNVRDTSMYFIEDNSKYHWHYILNKPSL